MQQESKYAGNQVKLSLAGSKVQGSKVQRLENSNQDVTFCLLRKRSSPTSKLEIPKPIALNL
jgi:hypothetical protein